MTGNSRFAVSLHILAYLAYRGAGPVASAEIARSVDTNPVVIRRLLAALVGAGLVKAQKGVAGGFTLSRPTAAISLLAVYRAVEPRPDHGLSHFSPNQSCPVGAKIEALLQAVFGKAQASMESELEQVSLADLDRQLRPVCPGHAKPHKGAA